MGYSIELCMAYILYFPLCAALLFTGVLSCGGRIQQLGGRPLEVQLEQQQRKMQRNSDNNDDPEEQGVEVQAAEF